MHLYNGWLNPDEPGKEGEDIKEWMPRPRVKNLYCPVDGHYCEQPSCENCNFEKVGINNG